MNLSGEPVYVGRDFGGRDLVVDRATVDAYLDAVDEDPARYGDDAPALVLHSECYHDLSWYLANIIGNLHGRQEWEMFAPIRVGDAVRTRGFIRERYHKRGRNYVVKETWILDGDGRLLNRGLTHQSFLAEEVAAGVDVVDKDREKQSGRRFDIADGDGPLLDPLSKHVSERMCMAFSGPVENYHTNREAARQLGFPDIVVQGMLPICFVSELLDRELGAGWRAGGKMDVRLVNVLWANETVRANARRTATVPEADRTRAHYDVWVEKDDGTKVVVGQASGLLPQ